MRSRQLPARTLAEVAEVFPAYRQSILSTMDNCALSTRFDLEGPSYSNAAQARGIIFHRFAAEVLRTLRRTGEVTIPSEEALTILYEVSRQREVPPADVVIVPARERRILRICALSLCSTALDVTRLMAVEERLETVVTYPTPGGTVYRTISGSPDAIIADPPGGAIVLDWKTEPSAPAPVPTDDEGNPQPPHWTGDHLHVSYGGYFQQRAYALLVLRNFPSVERVTLREWYVLPKEGRNATVPREALEHVEHELSVIAETLDRALMEGSASPIWAPSPGLHCGYCQRPTSCPIPKETRMTEGGITSDAEAARVAALVATLDPVRTESLKALKAYHDATSRPIPVKGAKRRQEWRWGEDSSGKRRFKLHATERAEPPDPDLAEAFVEAATRKREAVA
jgi:PD-(D/E)XK nuclease superfamily